MQINKNRKGLALSAVFALMASLFVGMAPAKANEASAVVFPAVGTESQTTTLITENFDLKLRFGTGVQAFYQNYTDDEGANETAAGWGLKIVKGDGVTISTRIDTSGGAGTAVTHIDGTEVFISVPSSTSTNVAISVSDKTSVSAAVSLTVTAWLDLDRDGALDSGEPLGNTMTLTFAPWSILGAAVTLEQPVANDQGATASFRVTQGSVNWAMLENTFGITILSTNDASDDYATFSANITPAQLSAVTNTTTNQTSVQAYSASYNVLTAPFTTSDVVHSVSATVLYNSVSIAVSTLAVEALTVGGVTMSAVAGANIDRTDDNNAFARFNSAFVVNAFAHTSSSFTTSMRSAVSVTVSGLANMELDADSGIVINGTTYTSAAAVLAAGFTLAAGTTTFAVSTFGQSDAAGADTITFRVYKGLSTKDLTVTFQDLGLTVAYTPTSVAGLAGASKTFTLAVEDRWGVAPVRTDLRVAASVNLSGSISETVSASVANGAATVTVTPVPAARTGSAVVYFTLQRFDQDTQAWVDLATDSAEWNVFSYAAGTDAFTSRTLSISASISYGVDLSWSSNVIAVGVANSFSTVVVSAPGLMIQNSDDATQTASDTLAISANVKTANFKFTSRTAGTYTVTFTNGTATTTSQVVVNPARDADGATITFDTTAIAAGSTKVITGTLVDANGNPVNTSGSATILVTYTVAGSAGIPIGAMPTETDADGKFTITVLTGANDSGTAVVSAAYYKSGASTAVADVLTFNQSIVVGGASSTAPASDQKLTVGSFKGFVAIYALNYTGQKLSAKVAGRWLVVNELTKFQRVVRNTGAGFTIKVDLYIDGAFVRSETVVTK